MGTRGRRLAIRLAACVLIGAVVTVAVAWGCGAFGKKPNLYSPGLESKFTRAAAWPRPVPALWPAPNYLFLERGIGCRFENFVEGEFRALVCVAAYGWPVVAMEWSCQRDRMRKGPVYGAIQITPKHVVPAFIRWPGFALDTAFYAAIAFTLWSGPAVIRRHRRRARGRCPACGYDLEGAPSRTCPECGT